MSDILRLIPNDIDDGDQPVFLQPIGERTSPRSQRKQDDLVLEPMWGGSSTLVLAENQAPEPKSGFRKRARGHIVNRTLQACCHTKDGAPQKRFKGIFVKSAAHLKQLQQKEAARQAAKELKLHTAELRWAKKVLEAAKLGKRPRGRPPTVRQAKLGVIPELAAIADTVTEPVSKSRSGDDGYYSDSNWAWWGNWNSSWNWNSWSSWTNSSWSSNSWSRDSWSTNQEWSQTREEDCFTYSDSSSSGFASPIPLKDATPFNQFDRSITPVDITDTLPADVPLPPVCEEDDDLMAPEFNSELESLISPLTERILKMQQQLAAPRVNRRIEPNTAMGPPCKKPKLNEDDGVYNPGYEFQW